MLRYVKIILERIGLIVKRSSKILIMVLVIVATFSLGTVGGYLLFKGKYVNNKDNVQINNDKGNNSNKEENLSLDNNVIKELFDRKTNFHTTNKVTYGTLSDQKKLEVDLTGLKKKAFTNLNYKEVCTKLKNSGNKIMTDFYDTCMSLEGKWEGYEDLVAYYTLDDVRNNNIKYFNKSDDLPKEYSYVMSTTLKLEPRCEKVVLQSNDNYYLDLDTQCGYGGLSPQSKRKFIKAEKDDNELYIYDKYIIGTMSDSSKGKIVYDFYTDDDLTKAVTHYSFDEDKFDDEKELEVAEVLKYMKTYKHTYKLNDNGEYYWVSSEPFNNID